MEKVQHSSEDQKEKERVEALGTSDGKEVKLSRADQRAKERAEQEATVIFNQLADKFLEFFTDHDNPDSKEIVERAKQICAQWRVVCFRKKYLPHAYTMMDDYCNGIIKEYHVAKSGNTVVVPELTASQLAVG